MGRDINRPYFNKASVSAALQKPVVKALLQLMTLRRNMQAFNGDFRQALSNQHYQLNWQHNDNHANLTIALDSLTATLSWQNAGSPMQLISLDSLLDEPC